MQAKSTANEPLRIFVAKVRSAWNLFKKAFIAAASLFYRKAYLIESETSEPYLEQVRPIKKLWPVYRDDKNPKIREFNRLIAKLECIRKRTRKTRVKKKLDKRISRLIFKILVISVNYTWRWRFGS